MSVKNVRLSHCQARSETESRTGTLSSNSCAVVDFRGRSYILHVVPMPIADIVMVKVGYRVTLVAPVIGNRDALILVIKSKLKINFKYYLCKNGVFMY